MKKTKKIIENTLNKLKTKKKIFYDIFFRDLINISSCPICSSKKYNIIGKILLNKKNLCIQETSICNFCGHIFRSILPKNSWFKKCWNKIKEKKPLVINKKLEHLRKKRYEYYCKKYLPKIKDKKVCLLDIGAAFGTGALYFRKKGYDVECLEPEINRANFLKKKKFKVFNSFIENNKIKTKYDFIVFAHALEHCENIDLAVKNIKKIMAQNSLLYIEVPNAEKVIDFFDLFYTPHRNNFNAENLKYFLKKHNFEILNFKTKTFKDEGPVICVLLKQSNKAECYRNDLKIKKNIIERKKNLYLKQKKYYREVYVDKISNFFYIINTRLGNFTLSNKKLIFKHYDQKYSR